MQLTQKEYDRMVKAAAPDSRLSACCVKAFVSGGAVCALAQGLSVALDAAVGRKETADLLVTLTLILLTAVLTAFGVFDKLAKHAGAGTFVPITGFANAIVSPAMEYRTEGRILGTGAQMFRVAGPVLVYGSSLAAVYGLLYALFLRLRGGAA